MTRIQASAAGEAKRANIIDMALGFTAMMRVFSKGSKRMIEAKLGEFFSGLGEIRTGDDYQARHQAFCDWFTSEIWTAKKNGGRRVEPSTKASYGHAAKVLDIAIKVYVHYCQLPDVATAERLVPLLNGAVDTPILKELRAVGGVAEKVAARTIKEIGRDQYLFLQTVVRKKSLAGSMYPVEFDDVMWRELNRD